MKSVNREKAIALFAEGKSINAVAKALGVTWAHAKALQPRDGASALGGGGNDADVWDLTIQVPGSQLTVIFEKLSTQEKATAIQSVLQGRVDALVSALEGGR